MNDLTTQICEIGAGRERKRDIWERLGQGQIRFQGAGWANEYTKQVRLHTEHRVQTSIYWLGINELSQRLGYETGNWGVQHADTIWQRPRNGIDASVVHVIYQHMTVLRVLQFSMVIIREGTSLTRRVRKGMRWRNEERKEKEGPVREDKWVGILAMAGWAHLEEVTLRATCRAAQDDLEHRWDQECERRQKKKLHTMRAIRIRLGRRIDNWRQALERLRVAVAQGVRFGITTKA